MTYMGSLSVVLLIVAAALVAPSAQAAEGNPDAGKAQSITCAACHGQDGATPIDPSYPALAGQNASYLTRQLQMIQSNERSVPLMTGQLNGKSEQDLADLAAYYASLPDKVSQAEADDETLALADPFRCRESRRRRTAARFCGTVDRGCPQNR
jgi:cytochrome c553